MLSATLSVAGIKCLEITVAATLADSYLVEPLKLECAALEPNSTIKQHAYYEQFLQWLQS
jgi:hypothetical protein